MVRSCFTALHAVLYHCLPENQLIGQYVLILLLLTKLLKRAFEPFLEDCPGINPKIALLVCHDSLFRSSRAFIGFSVISPRPVRDKIIQSRQKILPALCNPHMPRDKLYWEPGNCAEAETFAHLKEAAEKWKGGKMLVVSLALDLKRLEPCRLCERCGYVIKELREQYKFSTIDLAPRKVS